MSACGCSVVVFSIIQCHSWSNGFQRLHLIFFLVKREHGPDHIEEALRATRRSWDTCRCCMQLVVTETKFRNVI